MVDEKVLSVEDYIVFSAVLVVSASIGVYFGFIRREKNEEENNAEEFLTGRGNISTFPVAMSLLAGFFTSVVLLGHPAEVYLFGPQLWCFGLASFIAIPVVLYVSIPFFRDLKATSVYEYFTQRFSRPVQVLGSSLFTLQYILYLSLILYASALALNQVTGVNTYIAVTTLCIICSFITVGGVRSVSWTVTFQVIVIFIVMAFILVQGTLAIGSVGLVFQKNAQHKRNNFFDLSPDLTVRFSIMGAMLGGASIHIALFCGSQFQIQRFASVPSDKEARKLVWIYATCWSLVTMMTAYTGMLVFARYADCDPITTGRIVAADRILPYYVMDVLGHLKGMPGLFIAGLYSAALSTVSTGMNSLAAIWFSELAGTKLKKWMGCLLSDEIIVKLITLIIGLSLFAVSFLVPYMGSMFQVTMILYGFIPGALAGVFFLGRYITFANSWGACMGLLSAASVVFCLAIGAQIAASNGLAIYSFLPLSTAGCPDNTTITAAVFKPLAPAPYRLSFSWYTLLSFGLTVVVGIIVSLIVRCVQAQVKQRTRKVQKEETPMLTVNWIDNVNKSLSLTQTN